MPAQLCSPAQSKAQLWALGYPTWEPGASQPCMWGGFHKSFWRTNSLPCSLGSSGDTFTRFQPQDTWDPVLQRLSVLQGTPAWEQSSPSQPMRKMSLCEAPPEALQENFLERASLIYKHFFLPRGDFFKTKFYLALRWLSRHCKEQLRGKQRQHLQCRGIEMLLSCHCSWSDAGCQWDDGRLPVVITKGSADK